MAAAIGRARCYTAAARRSSTRKGPHMPPYHILALDGGGIRGLLTTILLERLEAAVPGFLSHIDLFAGTSTGGILALGLASGITPTAARDLYEGKGPEVSAESMLHTV